jgi:dynein heavy chain, axonemal
MANNECARPFPDEGTIYDYKYSEEACEGSGNWIGWMDSVEVYKLDPKLGFSELIVPTADSICYTFLLDQVSYLLVLLLCLVRLFRDYTLSINTVCWYC